MAQQGDDELRALRERAYGPHADISLDSVALKRLRELEGGGREQKSPTVEGSPELSPEPVAFVKDGSEPSTRDRFQSLSRVRRSTVLLFVGLAFVGMIIAVSPALIDRIHTDPLQVGADQVARLSVEPGYRVPSFFNGAPTSNNSIPQGFQAFHGLRVVKSDFGIFASGPDDSCLTIYVDADITDPGTNSLSGPSFFGCSAAGFPATVQFVVTAYGLPEELTSAFPGSRALHFVYDRTHNAVVVFAEPAEGS